MFEVDALAFLESVVRLLTTAYIFYKFDLNPMHVKKVEEKLRRIKIL
jgi:hypothetical protein